MKSKPYIKPLELVVSAIHCLGEKKGSSLQNIIRYLSRKYNLGAKLLRGRVQTALKRGVSSGMLTPQLGLYRLNKAKISRLGFTIPRIKSKKINLHKIKKPVKKCKLRHPVGKTGRRKVFKLTLSPSHKAKRKVKKIKDKRERNSRVIQNDMKRKQKRQKTKGKRAKHGTEKKKKAVKRETTKEAA